MGSITCIVAATGAFLELQAALNTIWRVTPNPRANLRGFVTDRLRSFGLVVAIGFLLMVSLAVTAALAALNAWLAHRSPSIPLAWNGVNVLVSLVVTTALFALLYRFLPDVRLRWRDVTIGAFVTAVLFTIGQQLIGLYLGQSSVASSYSAAGSVMILLLWVYCSCQIRPARCRVRSGLRAAPRRQGPPRVIREEGPQVRVCRASGRAHT